MGKNPESKQANASKMLIVDETPYWVLLPVIAAWGA
jgi:hypothetical protein